MQSQLYLAQQGGPGEFEGTGLGAPKRGLHPSVRHKMERDRLFFSDKEEGSRHESEEGDYFPDGTGERRCSDYFPDGTGERQCSDYFPDGTGETLI